MSYSYLDMVHLCSRAAWEIADRREKKMSVLIKGLKKPKDCYQCRLHYGHGECGVSVDGNCPIIELPDHGDLVDVDLLKAECKEPNVWWETEYQMGYVLAAAQVIIPAERSEE